MMRVPTLRGLIDRRVLVNYRVDADVARRVLPAPFRPKLVRGYVMAGICLIRLKHIRPSIVPVPIGLGSENAAHRFAVEWDANGQTRRGVFVPRRDTSSRLNSMVGGTVFPGEHHHAQFDINEAGDRLQVAFRSDDGSASVAVDANVSTDWPVDSIFGTAAEASAFFEADSLGYSATRDAGRFDGLELKCRKWAVTPLRVASVRSSYFEDRSMFPEGSVTFDCALLMRGIEHEWHSRAEICCEAVEAQ